MRILTVTHFYEDHGGGIERVAGQLSREFNNLGETAIWAASSIDSPPADVDAVPLACFDPIEKLTGLPMPIPGVGAIRKLRQAIRDSGTVIVHDALYATSVLAMVLAKLSRKRVILIQHISSIPFRSPALRGILKVCNTLVTGPMLRAADERVFISDVVRRELLGGSNLPFRLLFNGVDSRLFYPSSDVQKQTPPARILFVGRFVEKKGLEVVRAVAAAQPDIEFLLAGSGPLKPRKWGLANVHDLGPLQPADLADLYRSVDLLLLPSVGEGYPLVIQEAMASGLPIICGHPSEQADPAASRWLRGVAIDLSQPEATAERVSRALETYRLSEEDRADMATYARRTYDWRAMAEALLMMAKPTMSSPTAVPT